MKEEQRSNPSTDTGQSMAILGHELDNVLNGLLGMTRLLRDTGLNAEQDRWSRAIEQSGRQLCRLVSAFRASAALQSEPAPSTAETPFRYGADGGRESLDGIDLLEQVVISQAPLASRQGNRILLTVEPAVPRDWLGDACRLRQLLDNLLGNANKFTAGGEILLRAWLEPAKNKAAAPVLRLSVTDSGPGVDPAAMTRVFDAWEQESDRTRLAYGGSGLGLFVCREAVGAMGGTIGLSSPPEGGACFEVGLPGVARNGGPSPLASSSILSRVECVLELGQPLLASIEGWLYRLGVRCRPGESGRQQPSAGRLQVRVTELPGCALQPGPTLLLEPLDGRPAADCARRLPAPIVGSSLGPLLLELALEWLWLRNDRPGSAPSRQR